MPDNIFLSDCRALPSEEPFLFQPPRNLRIWPRVRNVLNQIGALGMVTLTAGYTWLRSPFQVDFPMIPMPLPNLPPSFEGFRIVQITDLHTGRTTPIEFIRDMIDQVNRMGADLVAVTGDLISGRRKHVATVCDLLGELKHPTVVSFGNHDYAHRQRPWQSSELADALQANLEYRGITVLRNQAMPLEHADGRIWIVGMEDLWSTRFSPRQAFSAIRSCGPVVALSHNPDTADAMAAFGADWVLSGHTHGGQIRVPIVGPAMLPMEKKHLDQGLFRIGNTHLYVCRGMGFRLRVRFRCPPEIPTFVLERRQS